MRTLHARGISEFHFSDAVYGKNSTDDLRFRLNFDSGNKKEINNYGWKEHNKIRANVKFSSEILLNAENMAIGIFGKFCILLYCVRKCVTNLGTHFRP